MKRLHSVAALIAGCVSLLACSGGPPPTPPIPTPAASTAQPAAATATTEPGPTTGEPAPEAGSSFAARLEEAEAAQELGADFAKLLTIAKLSPKTHKNLLKSHLYKPTGECPGQALVDVAPGPGLLVAGGKSAKVRAKTYDGLKAAGALAKQRGMAIEIVAGHLSIKDAVKTWNHGMIEASFQLLKAASPADQKDKSFASEARKQIDAGESPKSWTAASCESGRIGGYAVDVQLVVVDAGGKRGAVMVKAEPEGDRFTKETFEATYWDKPKGKSFRMLTEIMSAGGFVRQCSEAFHFTSAPKQDGTWRCKQDTESWDPPNRPLPAWQ
jgi:D-alanyl-D-alanine dipeptidase